MVFFKTVKSETGLMLYKVDSPFLERVGGGHIRKQSHVSFYPETKINKL